VLEEHRDSETAEHRAEILRAMVNMVGSPRNLVKGDGKWLARSGRTVTLWNSEREARENGDAEAATAKWYLTARPNTVLEAAESPAAAGARLMDLAVKTGKLQWELTSRATGDVLGVALTPQEAADRARAIEEIMAAGRTWRRRGARRASSPGRTGERWRRSIPDPRRNRGWRTWKRSDRP
jgi:hypothetical protein